MLLLSHRRLVECAKILLLLLLHWLRLLLHVSLLLLPLCLLHELLLLHFSLQLLLLCLLVLLECFRLLVLIRLAEASERGLLLRRRLPLLLSWGSLGLVEIKWVKGRLLREGVGC